MGKLARGAWKSRLMVCVAAILFVAIPYSRAIAQQAPEKTIPVSQMTAQQLETRGDAFRSQKDPMSALESYNKAISKDSNNAVLWNKVGMIQLQFGASSQGPERLRRYAEAVNNLGVIYYQQEDYKKAISLYKRALSIRPTASFHSNLGSVYFAQKKFEDATQEYLEALRLDPDVFERSSATGILGRVSTPADRAKYAIMLAKLYAQLGDVDHALVQIRTALENGYSEMEPLYQDSEFSNVRKDPRFAELMQNKPTALPE